MGLKGREKGGDMSVSEKLNSLRDIDIFSTRNVTKTFSRQGFTSQSIASFINTVKALDEEGVNAFVTQTVKIRGGSKMVQNVSPHKIWPTLK